MPWRRRFRSAIPFTRVDVGCSVPSSIEHMILRVVLLTRSCGFMVTLDVVGGYQCDVVPGREIAVEGWKRFVEIEGRYCS